MRASVCPGFSKKAGEWEPAASVGSLWTRCTSIQKMIAQYEVGVFGPLNVTNAVLPYMRKRKPDVTLCS
jgi:NAD(P)-dependent dehydrogenase (short-subunit alcohol dehydrogenase family)